MRGKGCVIHFSCPPYGITPAYAGKSLTIQKMSTASRDHPRVCGEKFCLNVIPNSIKGSPPRMRGKVTLLYALADREGITPAYAGKSAVYAEIVLYCGDHPRVCGEKPFPARQARMCRGSPPRMRGKDRRAVDGKSPPGITPAYAGKRCWCGFSGRLGGDHPRVCGEKGRAVPPWAEEPGSPPRMRGKEERQSGGCAALGITPAYAGKRSASRATTSGPRDHPRVCGEKTKKIPSHRPFQLHPVPVSFSFA